MRSPRRMALAWLRRVRTRLRTGLRARLLVLGARRHLRAGRWEQGVAALRGALELRPQDFTALLWLSRAYLRVGEVSRARHILRRIPEGLRGRRSLRIVAAVQAEGYGSLERAPRARPGRENYRVGCITYACPPPDLPLGDCRDAAEQARFAGLPPLPGPGEVDWDEVGRSLQQGGEPQEGSRGPA